MGKYLIISLHDFHPGSHQAISEQIDFCSALGANCFSILAVPHFHHGKALSDDSLACDFLSQRQAHGDDIVLHGHYHDRADRSGGSLFYTKFYTANESEFLDLTNEEVLRRIEGDKIFWDKKGWNCNGFIAPAWLMPQKQDALLRNAGFTYTTRLGGIHLLKKNSFIATQSLCYSTRAAWRRSCSLVWNAWLFHRLRGREVIRLSLHPHDLDFVSIRKQIGYIVETALADGYQPLSYYRYATL